MSALIKIVNRLEYANYLIKRKATGDLESFAKKMNLSTRAVKMLLFEMRELGACIRYDRIRRTYYYTDHGEFCTSRFVKYGEIISRDQAAQIGKPEELCFSEKEIFILC